MLLWAGLLFFLLSTIPLLERMGLAYDEAFNGMIALDIIKKLKAGNWLGADWPLMLYYYVGMTRNYAIAACIMLFGQSVFALRLSPVIYAACTIPLVNWTVGRWFGKWTGTLCAFLFATHPVLSLSARVGNWREEIMQLFFVWLGLFLLEFSAKQKNRAYLYAGFFVFGVALWAKMMLLGYIAGFTVAALVFLKPTKNLLQKHLRVGPQSLWGCLFFLCAGALPLIYHNIRERGETIAKLLSAFLHKENLIEYNNFDFLNNLATRFHDYAFVFSGRIGHFGPAFNMPENHLFTTASVLAIVCLPFMVLFCKKLSHLRTKVLFAFICYAVLFVLTCFVPNSYMPGHVLIIAPFPSFAIALFLTSLTKLANRKTATTLVVVFLAVNTAVQTRIAASILTGIKQGRGYGFYSPAVNDAAKYMKQEGITRFVAITSMCKPIVEYITKGTITDPTNFEVLLEPDGEEKFYNRFLKGEKNFYILRQVRGPYFIDPPHFERIRPMLEADGVELEKLKSFQSAQGDTLFELYRADSTS